MTKKVLMVAYHYPPVRGSSGLQRTLKFSQYLRENGWEPIILTAHPRAYPQVGEDQLGEIPEEIIVKRAFALDTAKHLGVGGRYPGLLATPDRWVTWWMGAVPVGLNLIRRLKPQVIWSTYPIATAHLIGRTLHNMSGLPWVADFRDSMVDDDYPPDPKMRKVYSRIERRTVTTANKVVFTTPSVTRMYAERYQDLPESRWTFIRNGYDEENFRSVEGGSTVERRVPGAPIKLVHSGLLYPSERDPRPFFAAISELKKQGLVSASSLNIILRASGNEDTYIKMINDSGIGDIISLEPAIDYSDALKEMLGADGLLVFQAANCNHLIPAKVYEYLRAKRPILALTDRHGDTAQLLQECGVDTIAQLDSMEDIRTKLADFLDRIRKREGLKILDSQVSKYSRRSQAKELAKIFDSFS
ncbi:MAG TPA: glycosyltransferase [Chromatiales bacterium]|nr:glycosyltransferase [Chromatiales bacterium]